VLAVRRELICKRALKCGARFSPLHESVEVRKARHEVRVAEEP
jgi:hypothetical protein